MLLKNSPSFRDGSNRAPWSDYRSPGSYFITINTKNRVQFFGVIRKGLMCLNEAGTIANQNWQEIPNHFPNVRLGCHIIMPDHIHGIIRLLDDELYATRVQSSECKNLKTDVSALHATRLHKDLHMSAISPKKGSLGTVIRSYKSSVSRSIRLTDPTFEWQANYFDHIIRGHSSYDIISSYIKLNPLNWRKKSLYSLLKRID